MPKTKLWALLLGLLVLVPQALAQQTGQPGPGDLKQIIERAGEGFKSILYTSVSEIWRYASLAVGVGTMLAMLYLVFVQRRSWLLLIGEVIFLSFLYGLPFLIGVAAPFFGVPADKVAEWQCNAAGYIFYEQFCGGGAGSPTGNTGTTPRTVVGP